MAIDSKRTAVVTEKGEEGRERMGEGRGRVLRMKDHISS